MTADFFALEECVINQISLVHVLTPILSVINACCYACTLAM